MSKGTQNGIDIINDVSGLNFDNQSFNLINSKKIPFILHHMQGSPNTMQNNPTYEDVLLDIFDFFEEKINFCAKKILKLVTSTRFDGVWEKKELKNSKKRHFLFLNFYILHYL